ncbi:MAG: tetratricopeptide repeat protein, partial [Gammaproteobacteria bacterium]|nr:tetratricopeptide repeat protein [Gammaproteobacteria bacterium]
MFYSIQQRFIKHFTLKPLVGLMLVMLLMLGTAQAATDTPTIKNLIEDGISLLLKNDAHAAIKKFEKVLLLAPDHAEAHFRIGQAYMQRGQFEKGIEFIKKSTK